MRLTKQFTNAAVVLGALALAGHQSAMAAPGPKAVASPKTQSAVALQPAASSRPAVVPAASAGKAIAAGRATSGATRTGGAVPNVLLADPLGDWDGDGRSNLIEYALGTDPLNPSDNASGMQVTIMDLAGSKYLALTFRQRTQVDLGIDYVPEVSGDKQAWFSDNLHVSAVSVSPIDAQFNWVTVRDAAPLSPTTPRFIRLTIVQN